MTAKLTRCFTDSAAALLAAMAMALFLGNGASASTASPRELIFMAPMTVFFEILDALTLAVLLGILILRRPGLKLALILWFAIMVAIYRLGVQWHNGHMGGYLGPLAHTFNLSTGLTNRLLNGVFLYLLAGSALLLAGTWFQTRTIPPSPPSYKTACVHCGGHLAFSAPDLGRKIACPHCQTEITLAKPVGDEATGR